MHILALIPHKYGWTPGQRSSIELWERVLEGAGIHLHYVPFGTDRLHEVLYTPGCLSTKAVEMARAYAQRLRLLQDMDSFDAVLVYREAALLGPAFLEKRIAKRGKPIIYQLDDPLYLPYVSPSNGYLSYLKCFSKVAEICRLSRVVIANSTHIRDYVAQYNTNVWQIPSVVDTDRYVFSPRAPHADPVSIGWSGSFTTVGNLRIVAEALQALAQRVKHRVHLIGNTTFDLPGVRYSAQAWRADTEVEDLRMLDVGMVPVPVRPWNEHKFYLKVVQYMALGIPPVCTPLGSNPEVVEHGVTGFLAETRDEWVTSLERLITEPSLRHQMSVKAAQVARDRYSLQAHAERIVAAFRSAVS